MKSSSQRQNEVSGYAALRALIEGGIMEMEIPRFASILSCREGSAHRICPWGLPEAAL